MPANTKELISVTELHAEVRDSWGWSLPHLYRLVRDGEIASIRIAGKIRVPASEVDRLLGRTLTEAASA